MTGYTQQPEHNNGELEFLRGENAALKQTMQNMAERRKHLAMILGVICLCTAVAAGVLFWFFGGDDAKLNRAVKDAGKPQTQIVFEGKTFVPATEYENFVLQCHANRYTDWEPLIWPEEWYEDEYDDRLYDEKYAVYIAADGNKQKVLIGCGSEASYIHLTVGKKRYYYVDKTKKRLDAVDFTAAGEIECYNEDYYDYYYTDRNDMNDGEKQRFVDFYAKRSTPADEKIVAAYYEEDEETLLISYPDTYAVGERKFPMGHTFKDSKGNRYYYDYFDRQAYAIDEEVDWHAKENR